MKNIYLVSLFVLMFCCINSCNDTKTSSISYPSITVIGERTCTGKVVSLPNPPTNPNEPALPGTVLCLETVPEDYILTYNGHWLFEEMLTIDGVTYYLTDEVEITGTVKVTELSATQKYLELEIVEIKKI